MNNNNPNYVQRHGDNFFNGKISVPNYPALRPQLPYADPLERPVFATAEDFANMDSRVNNNLLGYYVSGGNIGKQLNIAAGLKVSGHLSHPNPLRSRGPNDINVQGTNISMEAMRAQGLLQRPNVGMYPQNPNFNMQQEEQSAIPMLRGGIMEYPVEMLLKEQLSDYSVSQLQQQHLPLAGLTAGFKLASPYLLHNQQQRSPTIGGARMGMLQGNSDSRLHSHATDPLPSMLDVQAHMEFGAVGVNHLNPVGAGGRFYDENLRQYVAHQQTQLQLPPAVSSNIGEHAEKWPIRHAADLYGMLGLLNVMESSQIIPVPAHGVGIDLTNLGLNLTQTDDLHKDFFSPFSEKSVKDCLKPEFVIPECYNAMGAADLQPSWFSRFSLMTLFYIFYSMPKDLAQLYAANELMNQKWFYHKVHRLWLIRDMGTKPIEKTETYERGAFIYFDPNEWKLIHQADFILRRESIEKRPALPNQPSRR